MKKVLQLTLLLALSLQGIAQTNVALTAVAAHSGGGATTYSAANYNDGIISAAPATLPWGWLSTNGWIEFTWPTAQIGINKLKVWKADRPMGSCTVEYWNGTAYVVVGTFTTSTSIFVDSFMFVSPITTTKLRMNTVAGSSNPNHREIEVFAGNPCPGMSSTTLNITNIGSTTATVSWGTVAGSAGYDYIVDTNPNVPWPNTPTTVSSSTTSANVTGLTPNTTYYLHARNRCNATDFSAWADKSFITFPPCSPPTGFNTTGLTPISTNINWNAWPLAVKYDYLVDQTSADPIGSTGTISTVNTSAPVSGLTENTKYYVHIRTHCSTNEISGWGLDSFTTPIPCRAPEIEIQYVNTDEAVAFWKDVTTATHYEYAITQSATPPSLGTKYNNTSIHTSALQDGKEYFIHVRSTCTSLNVVSTSPWATKSFKTFALGVNQAVNNGFKMAVYPNPAKNLLGVELKGINGDATISITDLAGRIVKSATVTGAEMSIDISELAPGSYIVKYTDQAQKEIIKISKQ